MSPTIRLEQPSDTPAIHTLTAAAFSNAPHTDHTEHFIVDALRAADALTVSLVAVDGDVIIGHVAMSPVSVSDGTPGWFGLGPVSVSPGRQGQGIGSRLIQEALRRLREHDAAGCVVLGEPGYYGRFGFRTEAGLVLPGLPAEYFQTLAFGDSPLPCGTVIYHEAFNARG